VSGVVLDHVVTVAASGVRDVLATERLVGSATVGATIGGVVGFAQGGPVGAAVGASVGSAAGAAAHLMWAQRSDALAEVVGPDWVAPPVRVAVVARFGADLEALADRVRAEVTDAIEAAVGLRPAVVTVEIVDVENPAQPLL